MTDYEKPDTELGRAIQMRRVELKMKRRDLAEAAGLSYPYVSEIENGQKAPSFKALMALSDALQLPPSHLLELAGRLGDDGMEESVLVSPMRSPSPRREAVQAYGQMSDDSLTWAVRDAVRAELERWSRSELPRLIRAELEKLRDEGERPSEAGNRSRAADD